MAIIRTTSDACFRTMPELPEVETIARGLQHKIAGKTIAAVEVLMAKIAVAPAGVGFGAALAGDRIEGVTRRGKYAVIGLASGRSLVTSLRMTGRLIVQQPPDPPYPYTYVHLRFEDGSRLAFADVRQFGPVRLRGGAHPRGC